MGGGEQEIEEVLNGVDVEEGKGRKQAARMGREREPEGYKQIFYHCTVILCNAKRYTLQLIFLFFNWNICISLIFCHIKSVLISFVKTGSIVS